MRRFYLPLLLILLLGTCTLGSSKEDKEEYDSEDKENPNHDDKDTGDDNTENNKTGKKCKKEKEKHSEKNENKNKKNKHSDCEEKSNGGTDQPVTSKMSTSTKISSSTSTRTSSSTSTRTPTRTPSSNSTGSPASASGGIDRVAIFVPIAIFLLLLVLLVAVFLWRYSDRFQCLRRFGGKDGNTVKTKPGSDVIALSATASHPPDSEHPGQHPLSGHIYQEISDVHMGASGPGSSYSTLGFPFQDQKAAVQQPADGQYSLVGLSAK